MWPFFAVWASCRDRSEAQTPATLTQCDLRQLGKAQEDTKNLYAARALPCTHRKLHLAVYTLWPTASLCEYFKKKRAKSLLVPFRGMIFISCAVQLADWGLLQEMRGNVEVVVLDWTGFQHQLSSLLNVRKHRKRLIMSCQSQCGIFGCLVFIRMCLCCEVTWWLTQGYRKIMSFVECLCQK